MNDLFYNIMLHSNSFTLGNLSLVNKNTFSIFNNKHFWAEKSQHKILNINELQRYEKCQSIAKNIIPLLKKEKQLDKFYSHACIEFKKENILQYLHENILVDINKFMMSNYLEELKNMVNYEQLLWIIYDDVNPQIEYTLYIDNDEIEISVDITINQLYDLILTILYIFPKIDITDTDYEITYLPKILNHEISLLSREEAIYRYKYWEKKQWFL